MIGVRAASFCPATTITKSVERARERIAAERKLSDDGTCRSDVGGHGSSALSRPMREDSPAARMTPAKLTDRDMVRTIAESRENVSDPERKSFNPKDTKSHEGKPEVPSSTLVSFVVPGFRFST